MSEFHKKLDDYLKSKMTQKEIDASESWPKTWELVKPTVLFLSAVLVLAVAVTIVVIR